MAGDMRHRGISSRAPVCEYRDHALACHTRRTHPPALKNSMSSVCGSHEVTRRRSSMYGMPPYTTYRGGTRHTKTLRAKHHSFHPHFTRSHNQNPPIPPCRSFPMAIPPLSRYGAKNRLVVNEPSCTIALLSRYIYICSGGKK